MTLIKDPFGFAALFLVPFFGQSKKGTNKKNRIERTVVEQYPASYIIHFFSDVCYPEARCSFFNQKVFSTAAEAWNSS
jgi:hypothetical protein